MNFRPEALRGSGPARPGASGRVDYRLARNAVLSEFAKGRLGRLDICDAHPELVRAARNVGTPTSERCPICADSDLVLVSYIFGPGLPSHGRCVTSRQEVAKLDRRAAELACYVVEVCPECRWNHLSQTYPLGRPARS